MVNFQLTSSDDLLALVKRPRAIQNAELMKSLSTSYISILSPENKLFC